MSLSSFQFQLLEKVEQKGRPVPRQKGGESRRFHQNLFSNTGPPFVYKLLQVITSYKKKWLRLLDD
jgi:hypothetical protein